VKNRIINLFLILSIIGVLDASYLTWSHFQGGDVGCFLVEGCNVVLESGYALIFGIPVSLLGLMYYSLIFIGIIFYNFSRKASLIKNISIFTVVGFLASIWFLYLQAFILKEYCSYCLVSALASILLFLLGVYALRMQK
jgi:uncharacterized membrane protein